MERLNESGIASTGKYMQLAAVGTLTRVQFRRVHMFVLTPRLVAAIISGSKLDSVASSNSKFVWMFTIEQIERAGRSRMDLENGRVSRRDDFRRHPQRYCSSAIKRCCFALIFNPCSSYFCSSSGKFSMCLVSNYIFESWYEKIVRL